MPVTGATKINAAKKAGKANKAILVTESPVGTAVLTPDYATPAELGAAVAEGSDGRFSDAAHVHTHGDRTTDGGTQHDVAQITGAASDAELTAHEGGANPHPTYTTDAEAAAIAAAAVADHADDADPHTGYIKETEKGAASGVATLTAGIKVIQDPANANTTPGNGVIPKADAAGKIAAGFIQEVLAYADLTDDLAVLKSLYDAYSILMATADNTPIVLAVAEQTLLGRITGGAIAALTVAQIKTLLAYVHGDIGVSGMVQTLSLTAAGGKPTTTAGCAASATVEAGTNDVDYTVLDFDTATDEYAFWGPIAMPDNWDGGTLTAIFYWTAASGSGTVCWSIQLASRGDDDAIDAAWGTAVAVTDTLITAGDIHKSGATAAITPAGTPAGGEELFIRVMRDVSEDTLAVDARLIGAKLEYGVNALSA